MWSILVGETTYKRGMVFDQRMIVASDGYRYNVNPFWEEKIDGFSIITHEWFATLTHPKKGWRIPCGMWNTFRTIWGQNMVTLKRIHESCNSQTHLECADITPTGVTGHILQAIRRTWKTD